MWEGVRTPRGEFGKVKHRGVLAVGTLTHNLQFANHPMIKDFKLDCSIFEDCPSCLVFRFWIPGPKNWVGSCPKQIVFEKIPYLRPILCKHLNSGVVQVLIFENEEKVKDKDKICCPSFGWSVERICKLFLHFGFVFHKEMQGADRYFSDNITSRTCLLLVPPKN